MSGADPISPAPPIYVGEYWNAEHVWPTALVGWIVLVLRRHAEALHELTSKEFREFAELLRAVSVSLRHQTGCLKEYVACFTEAEGFGHIHVHLVPRAETLEPELRGPNVFGLLGAAVEPADRGEVIGFCDEARKLVAAEMAS